MDPIVLSAIITTIGLIAVAGINLYGISITNRKLSTIAQGVDGLTTARVKAETDLGDAKTEVARGQGRDEEREKQEHKAEALVASSTLPQPVHIEKSVPLELKK